MKCARMMVLAIRRVCVLASERSSLSAGGKIPNECAEAWEHLRIARSSGNPISVPLADAREKCRSSFVSLFVCVINIPVTPALVKD